MTDRTQNPKPLGLEWATVREIAAAGGISRRRASHVLNKLLIQGHVQRRTRTDGTALWRLAPRAARRIGGHR